METVDVNTTRIALPWPEKHNRCPCLLDIDWIDGEANIYQSKFS